MMKLSLATLALAGSASASQNGVEVMNGGEITQTPCQREHDCSPEDDHDCHRISNREQLYRNACNGIVNSPTKCTGCKEITQGYNADLYPMSQLGTDNVMIRDGNPLGQCDPQRQYQQTFSVPPEAMSSPVEKSLSATEGSGIYINTYDGQWSCDEQRNITLGTDNRITTVYLEPYHDTYNRTCCQQSSCCGPTAHDYAKDNKDGNGSCYYPDSEEDCCGCECDNEDEGNNLNRALSAARNSPNCMCCVEKVDSTKEIYNNNAELRTQQTCDNRGPKCCNGDNPFIIEVYKDNVELQKMGTYLYGIPYDGKNENPKAAYFINMQTQMDQARDADISNCAAGSESCYFGAGAAVSAWLNPTQWEGWKRLCAANFPKNKDCVGDSGCCEPCSTEHGPDDPCCCNQISSTSCEFQGGAPDWKETVPGRLWKRIVKLNDDNNRLGDNRFIKNDKDRESMKNLAHFYKWCAKYRDYIDDAQLSENFNDDDEYCEKDQHEENIKNLRIWQHSVAMTGFFWADYSLQETFFTRSCYEDLRPDREAMRAPNHEYPDQLVETGAYYGMRYLTYTIMFPSEMRGEKWLETAEEDYFEFTVQQLKNANAIATMNQSRGAHPYCCCVPVFFCSAMVDRCVSSCCGIDSYIESDHCVWNIWGPIIAGTSVLWWTVGLFIGCMFCAKDEEPRPTPPPPAPKPEPAPKPAPKPEPIAIAKVDKPNAQIVEEPSKGPCIGAVVGIAAAALAVVAVLVACSQKKRTGGELAAAAADNEDL